MPQDYEPEVFAQSVTKDSFCFLWCAWFLHCVSSAGVAGFMQLITGGDSAALGKLRDESYCAILTQCAIAKEDMPGRSKRRRFT